MGRDLVSRFQAARSDASLVMLEGFHALKHALRFEAEILEVAVPERTRLDTLTAGLAPDLDLSGMPVAEVTAEEFGRLSPARTPTGVIAIARRPPAHAASVLASAGPAPVVLLENTRRLENIGACVRVAAAAGAAGLLCIGDQDPWHPAAIRGAAGLQFALPVARAETLPPTDRPLIAFDAAGEPLGRGGVPDRALLAFGTERAGLGEELRAAAHRLVRIPMRPGVSSLNLATAVAVALYAWRGIAR